MFTLPGRLAAPSDPGRHTVGRAVGGWRRPPCAADRRGHAARMLEGVLNIAGSDGIFDADGEGDCGQPFLLLLPDCSRATTRGETSWHPSSR
jgi:hypothetical protein